MGLRLCLASALMMLAAPPATADLDEFKVKRQEVFEFAEKPRAAREGDKVTITFASKAFCDATVAIEEAGSGQGDPRIVRHLASGCLGKNAPPPFQKDSLSQTVVWDSKDDRGQYVQNRDRLAVRVSLGLRARLERTLYWSPRKRADQGFARGTAIAAAPEGVYVYDGGQAADHIRLFSHAGEYLRTIYPFPADKLKDTPGLIWHEFPQDGAKLPIKPSYQMCTLLTAGDNALNICFKDGKYFYAGMDPAHKGEHGRATIDLAVAGTRIAVASHRLNRLATDGGSGGLPVYGPNVDLRNPKGWYKATESAMVVNLGGYGQLTNVRPNRFALTPDGKTLYLTRHIETYNLDMYRHNYWQHGVYRMAYEGDKEPDLFKGGPEPGSDADHFLMPADVACDARGRVYVADAGNHRVQVYEPDGRLVTSIPVESPTQLVIAPKSGELYVFSWPILGNRTNEGPKIKRPFVMRKFKSADDPKLLATLDLPMSDSNGRNEQFAEVDFWAEGGEARPTFWVSPGRIRVSNKPDDPRTAETGILILAEKDGRLEVLRDFQAEARGEVPETGAPENNRQRLYFDPMHQLLFVGEGGFHFQDAVVIDVLTGKARQIKIPFDAEDMCFDVNGIAYLRTPTLVAKYDPVTWREMPWDYGEEREHVTYNSNSGRREAKVVSGLALPSNSGWHHGGMYVSPKGNLAVGCLNLYGVKERGPMGQPPVPPGKEYTPKLYPGRITNHVYGAEYVHVWDEHGRLLHEDAIPGLVTLNGVGIDNDDGLYVLASTPRMHEGKPHFNFLAGTLMKFQPGKGKIYWPGEKGVPIPLSPEGQPKRPMDVGSAWVDGADWFFGGVGWFGKNHGLGCGCRNTRFGLDYFGRSFAPEMDRYSVAVLDKAGNVILRVGRYGNVDDGNPLIAAGGPPKTQAIGGDEVSLMHGAYVAVQSDRRLFVADIGNYRIVSVKLDYYANETVPVQ